MSNALKIAVERAVRPVEAPVSTKLRMREELLAHLEAVYAEETDRGGVPEDVLRRTLTRFGEPRDLTADLQRTLNWQERYEAWLNRCVTTHAGEPPVRSALRLAGVMLAVTSSAFAVILLLKILPGLGRPVPLAVALALIVMQTLGTFAVSWIAYRVLQSLPVPAFPVWTSARVWGAALAAACIVGGLGLGLMAFVGRGFDVPAISVRQWLMLSGATIVLFMGSLTAYQWERHRVWEWEALDLTAGE